MSDTKKDALFEGTLFGIEPGGYSKWTHVQTPDSGVLTMKKLNRAMEIVKERSGLSAASTGMCKHGTFPRWGCPSCDTEAMEAP